MAHHYQWIAIWCPMPLANQKKSKRNQQWNIFFENHRRAAYNTLCVYVCVCERERERDGGRELVCTHTGIVVWVSFLFINEMKCSSPTHLRKKEIIDHNRLAYLLAYLFHSLGDIPNKPVQDLHKKNHHTNKQSNHCLNHCHSWWQWIPKKSSIENVRSYLNYDVIKFKK